MPLLKNVSKAAKASVKTGIMLSGSYKVPLNITVRFRDDVVEK
jgi:hypothetical protein